MRNGTASSQLITHYLRLGMMREKSRLELKKMESDIALQEAKKESLFSTQRIEDLYENAMRAMREYQGHRHRVHDDEEY